MPDSTSQAHPFTIDYWKLTTIVLGIALVIAIASHAGPSKASARTQPNLLALHQAQAAVEASQTLSVGGFDSIDGQPAFVIVNQAGQRVGALPMSAMGSDQDSSASASSE